LPALRERREDIPELVTHFVKIFSRRMGKRIDSIPSEMMTAFQWHSWPGNIRELQNLVERAVILSRDGVLPNPLFQRRTGPINLSVHRTQASQLSMTSEDSDRALIVETLEQLGWVVGGPRGAAARLGLKRTTLLAKMRRLGLSRPVAEQGAGVSGVAQKDGQI
jgi:formate hydrogenlyase transcriptional activator